MRCRKMPSMQCDKGGFLGLLRLPPKGVQLVSSAIFSILATHEAPPLPSMSFL